MEDKIKGILADVLEVPVSAIGEDFGPDSCPNWDSLNNLRIITALEEGFAVKFSWPEINALNNFTGIRNVVARKLEEA